MMYSNKMSELFKNISATITEPNLGDYRKKIQILLTDIGGKWSINNLKSKPSLINRPILSKEAQKK